MHEENIKLIEKQNDTMWFEGSPMAIRAVRLALEIDTGIVFTSAKFVNLRDAVVMSMTFDVICYDAVRKPINRLTNLRFDRLEAERNAAFGYERRIEVPDIDTRNVEYILQSVTYADGQTWHNPDDRRFDKRLEQQNIYAVQGHYHRQFRDICTRSGIEGQNLVLQPVFDKDHWLCACGAFNWADEEQCSQCSVSREWLRRSTDLDLLRQKQEQQVQTAQQVQQQVAAYDSQEDRDAQKAEFAERNERYQQEVKRQKRQMTRRTICIVAAVLLVLAVVLYVLITFVFPKFGAAEASEKNAKVGAVAVTVQTVPLSAENDTGR